MKILLTGIHGFIGRNLVKALADEHTLYGVDIVTPKQNGVVKTFSWKELEENKVPQVDVIIHLAGKAHDVKQKAKTAEYFKVNTGLTIKIMDYFTVSTAKKFIFFSSVKAAVDCVKGDFLTEEQPTNPVGPYGESKMKAEQYIQQQLCTNAALADKEVVILRPCMIHGPGNKGNLNLLFAMVKKGIPWPLGSFENKRSFTSIGNLCFVMQLLLTKKVQSGVYQMGDDEPISTNQLIRIMCETTGKRARIWHLNRGGMRALAHLGTCLHLPYTSERLKKLTENYVVSNQKIKGMLGIEKMPITAEEGLRQTMRSFQSKAL